MFQILVKYTIQPPENVHKKMDTEEEAASGSLAKLAKKQKTVTSPE